jgi:uncharacterized protein
MKNLPAAIVLFFVLLFAYTKLVGPIPLSVDSVVTTKTDTFTVTGEGKATAVPDIAVVTAGVQAQGSTVKAVQNELNTKMNTMTNAIKSLGIDAKDIQTSNYSIFPTYDYNNATPRITGYQANSDLTIKVRVMDKASSVIDAATTNGSNNVSNVSFDVSDKTKAENTARDLAVKEAKTKAQIAARTAGFTLGRVINYSENNGNEIRPVSLMAKADSAVGAGAAPATQIEPGSSEIVIDVSLSYEIR